jgi:hypothetical protein
MGIQREIWQSHIEENLFQNNNFLLAATDDSQYVLQGKVVHIPQAGAKANVVKNRNILPASVGTRTDTDITYSLDEYTSDPILIPNADTVELSYNKRESVLSEHQSQLREKVANNAIYAWAPSAAASILRTSGPDTASHLDGTTGNRKVLTVADVKRAQLALNKQNIPMNDRYALLSADMYFQLLEQLGATDYRDFSAMADPKTGVLGMLYGFTIFQRPQVVTYDNSGTPVVNAVDAVVNATDNDAALFWHKDKVVRAIGEIKFFARTDDPTYYGDVYSFLVRMGARKRRDDQKGVVAIVQAPGGAQA